MILYLCFHYILQFFFVFRVVRFMEYRLCIFIWIIPSNFFSPFLFSRFSHSSLYILLLFFRFFTCFTSPPSFRFYSSSFLFSSSSPLLLSIDGFISCEVQWRQMLSIFLTINFSVIRFWILLIVKNNDSEIEFKSGNQPNTEQKTHFIPNSEDT